MAFATSNVRLDSSGSSWDLTGAWTGNSEDASGTITVGGAKIIACNFYNLDATSGEDRPTPCSASTDTTTGITTITVHNHSNVTNGIFSVRYI